MKKILAIDSSTEACSVALSTANGLVEEYQVSPRKHAELLLPMVDSVLANSSMKLKDIDAIACCVGPGAFTGLRIAISMAQSLGYAAGKPCIAISSLQLLAAESFATNHSKLCLTSIDARMSEVYFAGYVKADDGLPKLVTEECVIPPTDIGLSSELLKSVNLDTYPLTEISLAGSGWQAYDYDESLKKIKELPCYIIYPRAKFMLPLAAKAYAKDEIINAAKMRPSYLRNNVAKKKSAQK